MLMTGFTEHTTTHRAVPVSTGRESINVIMSVTIPSHGRSRHKTKQVTTSLTTEVSILLIIQTVVAYKVASIVSGQDVLGYICTTVLLTDGISVLLFTDRVYLYYCSLTGYICTTVH